MQKDINIRSHVYAQEEGEVLLWFCTCCSDSNPSGNEAHLFYIFLIVLLIYLAIFSDRTRDRFHALMTFNTLNSNRL